MFVGALQITSIRPFSAFCLPLMIPTFISLQLQDEWTQTDDL